MSIIKARTKRVRPNFNIEIVGNYPLYRVKDKVGDWIVVGSLHVYLPDLDVDLRGVHYLHKKKSFHIRLPSRKGEIDGESCLFQIFSFCSGETQALFMKTMKQKLRAFSKTEEFLRKVKEIR